MTHSAVLDAPAPQAVRSAGARPGAWPRSLCPECLEPFAAAQRAQIFCSPAHKRAYNNRWLQRGGVVAAIYSAARQTRGGTRGTEEQRAIGRRARRDADQTEQLWREQDRAANDGRGRMAALEYLALRYRRGLVDVITPRRPGGPRAATGDAR